MASAPFGHDRVAEVLPALGALFVEIMNFLENDPLANLETENTESGTTTDDDSTDLGDGDGGTGGRHDHPTRGPRQPRPDSNGAESSGQTMGHDDDQPGPSTPGDASELHREGSGLEEQMNGREVHGDQHYTCGPEEGDSQAAQQDDQGVPDAEDGPTGKMSTESREGTSQSQGPAAVALDRDEGDFRRDAGLLTAAEVSDAQGFREGKGSSRGKKSRKDSDRGSKKRRQKPDAEVKRGSGRRSRKPDPDQGSLHRFLRVL